MAFAGYEALRASFIRFQQGGLAIEPGLPTIVLLFSAAVKVGMYLFIRNTARKLTSPTLNTAARDNLSDVLTSSAAFVGAFGSKLIHPITDPIAGFLVAIWIFRAAFLAARENLNFLTGAGASEELRQRIIQEASSVPGVLRVHHLMTDYSGPRLIADLHVNVDGNTTLTESHRITDEIIARLEAMPEIDRAYVHLEPDDWE
jgi:cation diffusion facilitator family transporter